MKLQFDSESTALVIIAVCVLTVLFAWRQNRGVRVGGTISLPKTVWLSFALIVFFALPFCLWRNPSLSVPVRALFGWIFASFAVRAVVELWLLIFTRAWKCSYGIAHNVFTFLLITWLCTNVDFKAESIALGYVTLVQVTLVVESVMAWHFSRLASPSDGIYFASNKEKFRFVNTASWIAVAIGYPVLGGLLWISP